MIDQDVEAVKNGWKDAYGGAAEVAAALKTSLVPSPRIISGLNIGLTVPTVGARLPDDFC